MNEKSGFQDSWLVCRAGSHLCALPLGQTLEVMRLLAIEPLADAPAFLRGLAVIRGAPVPVLDLARVLGQARTTVERIVTIRAGGRVLGLAVAEVVGVRRRDEIGPHAPVPLLRAAAQDAISSIGTLDSEVLLFLEGLKLLEGVPA